MKVLKNVHAAHPIPVQISENGQKNVPLPFVAFALGNNLEGIEHYINLAKRVLSTLRGRCLFIDNYDLSRIMRISFDERVNELVSRLIGIEDRGRT